MLSPVDHVCAIYASKTELAETAGEFPADGLRKSERCGLCVYDRHRMPIAVIDARWPRIRSFVATVRITRTRSMIPTFSLSRRPTRSR